MGEDLAVYSRNEQSKNSQRGQDDQFLLQRQAVDQRSVWVIWRFVGAERMEEGCSVWVGDDHLVD